MNVFREFENIVRAALQEMQSDGKLSRELDLDRVTVEPPRDPNHGDIATNAAMVLAKPGGWKPRELADALAERLAQTAEVIECTVAGPGFINLRLSDRYWRERLAEVVAAGPAYGDGEPKAMGPVNVEYVSANPTGPLHVGHGRGAVFGDVLASLLAKAGYDVSREYYVNDAGAQVEVLARSTWLRYREALGEDEGEIPEGLYPGEYLKPVGSALAERHGPTLLDMPEADALALVRDFAVECMMNLIRDDLAALGIVHDTFVSERALVDAGRVDEALALLEQRGLIYTGVLEPPKGKLPDDWEERPQTLFRATEFGDDVDRPLKKSDGSWTYFATDIAYHLDKMRRGFPTLIDVWGADHGGYVKRVNAAVRAIGGGDAELDVKLCQMVRLTRAGELVKMSKRGGTFVTLREVVDEVGKDVVRFIMLTRKNDAPLDFDLEKVVEQSRDNPVFYVQYAHARARSVMRHASELLGDEGVTPAALSGVALDRLDDPDEIALIRTLANWPRIVETSAAAHEPHRIAFYLYDLASAFHVLWTKGREDSRLRFIHESDLELTQARLALVQGMATVIASGLLVMGVEPVEAM